jgi:hypothetical protein
MMHTLTTGGNFNCGTDGGLKTNRGTFGLVVLAEDKIVWEGCGPVDVQTVIQTQPAPNDPNYLDMQLFSNFSSSSKGAHMSSRFIYEGFYCWYEQGGLYNL